MVSYIFFVCVYMFYVCLYIKEVNKNNNKIQDRKYSKLIEIQLICKERKRTWIIKMFYWNPQSRRKYKMKTEVKTKHGWKERREKPLLQGQSSVSLSQQLLGQAGKKPSNHKAELYTANWCVCVNRLLSTSTAEHTLLPQSECSQRKAPWWTIKQTSATL